MLKAYPNMTLDYVLYDLSFSNLRMYGSVLPSYNTKDDKKKTSVSSKGNTGGLKGLFSKLKGL